MIFDPTAEVEIPDVARGFDVEGRFVFVASGTGDLLILWRDTLKVYRTVPVLGYAVTVNVGPKPEAIARIFVGVAGGGIRIVEWTYPGYHLFSEIGGFRTDPGRTDFEAALHKDGLWVCSGNKLLKGRLVER